ncbi:MAG TPA: HEAT repeat domain-containing protein [Gemmatimonadaceae bacterium]|nr:HEAT repeat domain-containing protein [Gemmatimonadaceae bacterium]
MSQRRKSVGVFTTDRALVIQTWDPWLSEATGIAESTACGTPLAELYPELLERGLLSRLRRVADEGNVEVLAPAFHQYLLPCAPLDASSPFKRMRQHVTLAPLRTGTSIDGVVVTIEDVTSRLQREQDLAVQLESHDEEVRLKAAQALATAGGTSALSDALADRSWRVRRAAADSLARTSGTQAVDTLIEAIRERHQDPAVLNSALTALARSRQDVVGAVVSLLSLDDAAVRTYAALALGLLEDSRAVPPLLDLLSDADTNVRYHAIEALGRIGDPSAAGPLVEIAESRDFFLSFAALDALALIGESFVASRLLPLLDDDVLRAPAALTIGAIAGEEIAGALAPLLSPKFPDPIVIAKALVAIDARLNRGGTGQSGVGDRVRMHAPQETAGMFVQRLVALGDVEAEAVAVVLAWLQADGIEDALASLLERDGTRQRASLLLAQRGVAAVDALLRALRQGDAAVQQACAVALGRIGDSRALPDLMHLLGGEPEVAIAAAGALAALGDRGAFERLLSQLGHPHAMVRQAAVSALNSIGHRDTEWAVASRLTDPDPRVRESAARISGYFGFRSALGPLLALAHDPDESVRRAAVEHLANYDDEEAARTIHAAVENDPAVSVRSAAIRALGQVETPGAIEALTKACDDANLWIRYFAVRTLARRGEVDEQTPQVMIRLAMSDPMPPVRIAALDAIADLKEHRAATAIATLADDSETEVACAAVATLGRIGGAEQEALLLGLLDRGQHELIAAALDAVGRLKVRPAVPRLRALARESDDWELRVRAVQALADIGGDDATSALLDLSRVGRLRRPVNAALRAVGAA